MHFIEIQIYTIFQIFIPIIVVQYANFNQQKNCASFLFMQSAFFVYYAVCKWFMVCIISIIINKLQFILQIKKAKPVLHGFAFLKKE